MTQRKDSTAMVEVERLDPTLPLLKELQLWLLTRRLLRVFIDLGDGPMQTTRARDELEARNILDRWLLSFQLDHRGAMNPDMPILPLRLSLMDDINQKLINECLEKQFSSNRDNAECIAKVLIDSVETIPAELGRRVKHDLDAIASTAVITFWERRSPAAGRHMEGQLRIGAHYKSPCCARMWFLMRNFGLFNTARMMLRYETLGTGSLQWGNPVTVHHTLYKLMEVRYEGFASPLNSKLLGKSNAAFCSLFKDTDAPFGSLGEFFSVNFEELPGGWTVNPPFIEELMSRVADKVLQHLDRETGKNWFFVTFPKWNDSAGWQKLSESRHLTHLWNLPPRKFTMQDCYGNVLVPKMSLSIFALGPLPSRISQDYEAIKQCFLSADVASVESFWRQHCSSVSRSGIVL